MANFGTWDYIVFVLMLIISASIGIYYRFTGGKQKTTNEYFLANRNISIWPVSFSLMASFMSAITLLGVSMENYQYGSIFIVINISYGLATPIAAYLYLPVFFKLQATSAYEYLEKRFGKSTRLCASIAYSLQMILYMGIVLYAPALALEAVTGISQAQAILAIGFVCTFYSTIGGMKAVLITDVFQSLLMFAAVYTIIIVAAIRAGGLSEIWQTAMDGGRLEFIKFSTDPTARHTWFSLIIGGGFTYLSLYAVNQTQVQRLLTVKDLRSSQMALWMNWPILSLLSFSTSFSGLAIYYIYSQCDPLLQGRIASRDQLMPLVVVDLMKNMPGLPGLFVAGIFSASLSTVSAAVNSLAAVTIEDYIKPLYQMIKKKPLPETKSTLPSKVTACLYGFICVGIAFIAQYLGGVLQASLTVFGVVGGPLFGLFTLGMFFTSPNQKGAITGLLTGIALSLWIGFGQPKPIPETLSFSLENCTEFDGLRSFIGRNSLNNDSTDAAVAAADPINFQWIINATTSTVTENLIRSDANGSADDAEYFYLYRISYLWYGVIGFLITVIVGWCVSNLMELLNYGGKKTIYMDNNRAFINVDLFTPPIAYRLRKQNEKYLLNSDRHNIETKQTIASTDF